MNDTELPIITDISPKRIVVINTAFLGDLILTIPFLSLLKKKYPKSHIALVCKKGIGDFFIKLNIVDDVLEVQKGSRDDYSTAIQKLNEQPTDFLFCIHRSFRSYLLSLKIRSRMRLGYKLGFNFLGFHRRITRDLSLPEPLRVLQLLSLVDESFADFQTEETKNNDFNIKLSNQQMVPVPEWARFPVLPKVIDSLDRMDSMASFKEETKGLKQIAIFPGSVWNTKRWPVKYFYSIVDKLIQTNRAVILMGGPGEEIYGQIIEKNITTSKKILNLMGKTTVIQSLLILSHCDLVIANDSASAHLAALLGKKILVFFGPTVLNFGYRPWGNSVFVMENNQLSCRPCGSHGPQECPIKTHVCMTSISAESVLNKVESIL